MQYILTREEYINLVPREDLKKSDEKVRLLNSKVMELSEHPCRRGIGGRSFTSYCDGCPIGAFGTKTCTEQQQYSK